MIFDRSWRIALAVIREEANLTKPNAGQDDCAIAAFAFGLTLIQAQYFNDLLKELIQPASIWIKRRNAAPSTPSVPFRFAAMTAAKTSGSGRISKMA